MMACAKDGRTSVPPRRQDSDSGMPIAACTNRSPGKVRNAELPEEVQRLFGMYANRVARRDGSGAHDSHANCHGGSGGRNGVPKRLTTLGA